MSSRVRWEAPNSVNLLRYEKPGDPTEPPRCTAERRFARVQAVEMVLDR